MKSAIKRAWRARRAIRIAERQLLERCADCMIRDHRRAGAVQTCKECRARIARHAIRLAAEGGSRQMNCCNCGQYVGNDFAGYEKDRVSDRGRLWCERCVVSMSTTE